MVSCSPERRPRAARAGPLDRIRAGIRRCDAPGPRGRGRRPGARGNHRRAEGPAKGARLPVGVEPESPPPKGLTRGSVVGRAAA